MLEVQKWYSALKGGLKSLLSIFPCMINRDVCAALPDWLHNAPAFVSGLLPLGGTRDLPLASAPSLCPGKITSLLSLTTGTSYSRWLPLKVILWDTAMSPSTATAHLPLPNKWVSPCGTTPEANLCGWRWHLRSLSGWGSPWEFTHPSVSPRLSLSTTVLWSMWHRRLFNHNSLSLVDESSLWTGTVMVQKRAPGYLLSLFGMLTSASHQPVSWGIHVPTPPVQDGGRWIHEGGRGYISHNYLSCYIYFDLKAILLSTGRSGLIRFLITLQSHSGVKR